MSGKQRTLFQAWGAAVAPELLANKSTAKCASKGESVLSQGEPHRATPAPQQDEEEDDDVMLVAVYEAEKTFNTAAEPDHLPPSITQNLPGFDLSAGKVWIYPTNYPVREYQYAMVHTALLHNTLVCLPTGLGKTFIGAVLMYNFYRWYPSGKIVFMAPTKPLVAQQIEACFRVMGIPQEHMVEMTGNTQAQKRQDMWYQHRVFFLTPQIMVNDLTRGACPASEVKCLVLDEAHKALGNHAYCQVVRELSKYTTQFRILALSATPGGDTKSVQQVVSNLLIGRIELRSEDSPDIQPYSHERQLEKFVVPLGDELEAVQKSYLQVLETFAGRLIQHNVLIRRDIPSLTKYQIILFRDQFRKNPPSNVVGAQLGAIEGDFALCISLYHGYELLLQMGRRSLYYYLQSIMDGSKGMTRARNDLGRNADFMNLYQQLESMFSTSSGSIVEKPFIYSHPKLKKLEEVVIQHFDSWNKQGQNSTGKTPEDTRIMIFSSFRDSVQEIAEMLGRHHPTVRVMTFVGHSSTGKGVKGYTQKEQLEVVKLFREGGYNTLVSTCVGEEGLDIGEVDLIICFDAQKSPIRLVQRMGRTGRKRQGRIVVILCKGREERTYNQSQSNKRSIYKAILGNNTIFHLNNESPRMVPEGLNPTVHKMYITQETYDARDTTKHKDCRSSLVHRKSTVFSKREDTKKDGWCLTNAEFETWNSLHRLTESDGITDVVLPRTQFELFRDPENSKEQVSGTVHELSLVEWKLWQNRPFPTHLVDHSVRCKNFIAIMQQIEQMRGQEDSCSYEKEMNAFLDKVDVLPAKQDTRDCFAITSKPSKKQSSLKSKTCQNSNSLPIIENDEDFRPLVKRPLKSCYNERGNAGLIDYDLTMDTSCDAGMAQDLKKDDTFNDGMENVTSRDISPHPSEHTERLPTNDQKPAVKSPTKVDSGYHSLSEDPCDSLLNMFYTSYTPNNHNWASESIDKNPPAVSLMLSRVKKFLTSSPPSLSELDSLDDIDLSMDHLTFGSLSCEKANPNIAIEAHCSVQGSSSHIKNTDTLGDANCLALNYIAEKELCDIGLSTLSAQEGYVETKEKNEPDDKADQSDRHWDDIFDSDGEETYECNDDGTHIHFNMFASPCLLEDHTEHENKETCLSYRDIAEDEFCSSELFSVNFDLGFSFEDDDDVDEDSEKEVQRPNEGAEEDGNVKAPSPPAKSTILEDSEKESTQEVQRQNEGAEEDGNVKAPSPPTKGSSPDSEDDVVFRRKRKWAAAAVLKSPESASSECDFNSPMPGAKRHRRVLNIKSSSEGDFDSPMPGEKKCIWVPNSASSDDDLESPLIACVQDRGRPTEKSKHQSKQRHAARQFLDEEAELSSEEAENASSDESVDSDNVQDTSLVEFLNDDTQLSQALNDSEMHGIYMKSIRSPETGNRFKLTHKRHSMSVFSQIPEQDEDYMEDSFCVQEDDEEEEAADSSTEVQTELILLQDSFVGGRRQYCTRRRLKLQESKPSKQAQPAKRRRIVIHDESSDEEGQAASRHATFQANDSTPESCHAPSFSALKAGKALQEHNECFALPLKDRCQMRMNAQASLSDQLDFHTGAKFSSNSSRPGISSSNALSPGKVEDTCVKSAGDSTWMASSMNDSSMGKKFGSASSSDGLCILADTREISCGPEVISCLKSVHGVRVEICSLGGCDYIVSNRLSVERKLQSKFSNCTNRSKLAERIQHLRSMFDRICLIVEKDRMKPGETSRPFQRTKYYDSTLSALISAGVQVLFSSSQEETAGLLNELARLERRKNMAITVPTQVTKHKQDALSLYLSIPNISYITALNLCHHFSSMRHMANSSVDLLSSKGQVSRQKAEEIYRYLHYQFDPSMLQVDDKRKRRF